MKREFPDLPILCVGGVAVDIDGQSVLLIRRGKEPLQGEWTLPGGMVELGESLKAAVRREVWEETGIRVETLEFLALFERVVREKSGVRFHYVVADYLCQAKGGRLRPASDVTDARWVRRRDLAKYHLQPKAKEVIRQGFSVAAKLK
ncbi:MAG: NUDIX hydrolase [Terriglobia bacterium]